MERHMELLSPAGNREALSAAIACGADAVYLGYTAFSARAGAGNFSREELEKAVSDAVGKLSPELREVFLLRRENISFKEIAVIQKCSINTVLARMQYALKNLRKSLADWKS